MMEKNSNNVTLINKKKRILFSMRFFVSTKIEECDA